MKNKRIFLFTISFSIIFYVLGILTTSKISEYFFSTKYSELYNEINKLLSELERFEIILITQNLKLSCKDQYLIFNNFFEKLNEIRKKLPYRLEEEHYKVPKEILNEYFKLEFFIWSFGKNLENCSEYKIANILYFYYPFDEKSILQGKELDKIGKYLNEKGYNTYVYTIDINFDYLPTNLIKNKFNITSAPSFILFGKKFDFISFEEFKNVFEVYKAENK